MFIIEFNTSQKISGLMGQEFCFLGKSIPYKTLENGTTGIIYSSNNNIQ